MRDDPVVTLEENLLGLVPVTSSHGSLEQMVMSHVGILEDSILILEIAVSSLGRVGDGGETSSREVGWGGYGRRGSIGSSLGSGSSQ